MNYPKERGLQSQISILQIRKEQFKNDQYFTPEETEKLCRDIDLQIDALQEELGQLLAKDMDVVESDNPSF